MVQAIVNCSARGGPGHDIDVDVAGRATRREQGLETLTQRHFCSIARHTKVDMLF